LVLDTVRTPLGGEEFYEIKKILIGNFNWFYNNIWTVACVILTHIDAVWQFRQYQTPEDGHIGPKHVVLSENEKIIYYITDGIIDCLICHATGYLNIELYLWLLITRYLYFH
jgi:hypothetical protein